MKKVALLGLSIIALISSLLIGATAAVSAADGSQAWYFDETSGIDAGSLQMLRGVDTTTGSVLIPAGGSQTWIADESALGDVTFPDDGTWITTLTTDSNWAPTGQAPKITVEISSYNVAADQYSNFSTSTGAKFYIKAGKLIVEAEGMTGSETVPTGDYLAVTVYNNDSVGHLVDFTDGSSYLISPDTDPGYPLPEIAAGILMGGGIIGLVGFSLVRRKKATAS
jgi:hypothetical protein